MSEDKLEKLNDRIDKMFDRIEKKKISGELKSKYFSILE
jgi:hypothetical protein